jgi:hypothetical protein
MRHHFKGASIFDPEACSPSKHANVEMFEMFEFLRGLPEIPTCPFCFAHGKKKRHPHDTPVQLAQGDRSPEARLVEPDCLRAMGRLCCVASLCVTLYVSHYMSLQQGRYGSRPRNPRIQISVQLPS